MGQGIGSVLAALLQGASEGFVEAEQEDKLKKEQEKLDVKNRRFSLAKLIFDDPDATDEARQLSLQVLGGQNTGKVATQFDQFVALGSMEVPTPGGDVGSALPRGRPVELQGPPDQLNQEGNINRDAQAGITEGGPDVGAQLEEGLAQQPPSDFAELEQPPAELPPTGPTQEALDRRIITEPGRKNVNIFKTEIEKIEENFAANERVRDLNTQAALRDASVFLQGLPPEIPLEDKQAFFSMVRQTGDVIGAATALGFPLSTAQRKAFKEQALNSTRTEATTAFVANPNMNKADFVERYSPVLGREESEAMHTQLVQAEEQRERNVEEQQAKIDKLKADAEFVRQERVDGKPLTEANKISLKKDTTALRVKYNKLAGQFADSNGAEKVFLFGSTPPWAPRDKVIETLQAFAINIRSNEDRLGVALTQFGPELPDFETEEVGGPAAQQQGIAKAAGTMNLDQLGDALADATEAVNQPGLTPQQKAQVRLVQRTIEVEIQRRQEGLN